MNENSFKVSMSVKTLPPENVDQFHTFTAKILFASKKAQPDVQLTIAFLCSRVQSPTKEDWFKLTQMMKYLKQTRDDSLILRSDKSRVIKWYIGAAFVIQKDYKSPTL